MSKSALTKHQIYNNLVGFSDQDLNAIANFIDFMRYKKRFKEKKTIKLQGILKDHDIDFSDLKKFRKETWKHVEQEFGNE